MSTRFGQDGEYLLCYRSFVELIISKGTRLRKSKVARIFSSITQKDHIHRSPRLGNEISG